MQNNTVEIAGFIFVMRIVEHDSLLSNMNLYEKLHVNGKKLSAEDLFELLILRITVYYIAFASKL